LTFKIFCLSNHPTNREEGEEEKAEKPEGATTGAAVAITGGFGFGGGGLFGGGQGGQDAQQALTSLQQEGVAFKAFAAEQVAPAVLSANNPDLKVQPQGGLFGQPQPVNKPAQKKEKTDKKPKLSVFNAPKVTKSLEKKKPIPEVEEEKKEEEEEAENKSPSLFNPPAFGSSIFNPVPAAKPKKTKKSKGKKKQEEEAPKEDKE